MTRPPKYPRVVHNRRSDKVVRSRMCYLSFVGKFVPVNGTSGSLAPQTSALSKTRESKKKKKPGKRSTVRLWVDARHVDPDDGIHTFFLLAVLSEVNFLLRWPSGAVIAR